MTTLNSLKRKASLLLLLFVGFSNASAQVASSIDTTNFAASKALKFNYKQLILPVALIGYGVVGLQSDYLKDLNLDIRDEVV